MKKNKKSQAAMEFLMTYGWAILVVLVAIGALTYLVDWKNIGTSRPLSETEMNELCLTYCNDIEEMSYSGVCEINDDKETVTVGCHIGDDYKNVTLTRVYFLSLK